MLALAGCSLGLLWQLLHPRLPQGMPVLTPALKRHLWRLLRDEASQLSFSTEQLMQAARCGSSSRCAAVLRVVLQWLQLYTVQLGQAAQQRLLHHVLYCVLCVV
jgi:hypothetical protein